ncbi:MAG: CDP-glycerol glycerophosphotransferase family protein [Bacillota bacterium]|nr:CDP-glycerol glycerophosphotransferase family protein [Bacillota bacterium]
MSIKIATFFLNLIYFVIKLFPTTNKVTFISRQSNSPSQDALMLAKELKDKNSNIKVVMLFKKLDNKIVYCFHIIKQMYHIATSKTVILDSYCIVISLLKHKNDLKVVQMWHALGALKRFGYSILDEEEGSSSKLAEMMRMHKGYDVIFTSSEYCKESFAEAFGYKSDKLKVMSLPRVDLLRSSKYQATKRDEIYTVYPQLKEKETIVYAPTFRKSDLIVSDTNAIKKLINEIDKNKYNLVIKVHPLTNLEITEERIIVDNCFSTLDMLSVADYIVLDYSAILYEAALLNKPLFFYAFDLDEYTEKRNFYIDYEKEMPGAICKNANDVTKSIENKIYDVSKVKNFADKYIQNQENCTSEMVEYIIQLMGK